MNPLANAGVSGAVVSLVVSYLGRHGVTLSPDIVASLVTLTYTGTHYTGTLVNSLLARYAPSVEAVVQAVLPSVETVAPVVAAQLVPVTAAPVVAAAVGAVEAALPAGFSLVPTATVYPSVKAALGAVEAAVAAHG